MMNGLMKIGPEAVAPGLRASSKKQLLHELATRAADRLGLDARTVFEALMDRERLALTDDRRLAFTLARQHDKRPVSVH